MSVPRIAALLAGALLAAAPAHADEAFDVSSYEKKPFELTGFVELRPEQQWLRRDAAGYLLQFPGQTRDTMGRAGEALEVSGVLRRQSLAFRFTGHAGWSDDARGSDADARMYEAYAGWQANERTNLELGKRALRWGKGYAWSPTAFLERAKDPSDPELAREGFVMATAGWVRSFDAALQTLAINAALVPTTSGLNGDFGPAGHLNPAIKFYGLVLDTDVDLLWAGRGSRGPRFGADFSRNLGSNLEVHGEWARTADAPQALLTAGNALATHRRDSSSALLGLRYLTERDTTVIFELYRNGGGYSEGELARFFDLARASAAQPALLQPALRAAAAGYNRPNAARRYAYLRVSQKEPFDILDLTPSATVIANATDRSYTLIPELLYTGVRNLELRVRMAFNRGNAATEFGEKPVRSRLEVRARYFF